MISIYIPCVPLSTSNHCTCHGLDLSYCVYIPASMSHGMGQVEIKFFTKCVVKILNGC